MKPDKLTIFSLNCWLLLMPFSLRNNKRLKEIISLIKKLDPDIIALQEVWLNYYIKILKRELPEYTFTYSDTSLFNKGGLVTGSKIHAVATTAMFTPRADFNWPEKRGKKDTIFLNYSRMFFSSIPIFMQ